MLRQQTHIVRIIDANANRAVEGLRAVEDYARFALDDGHLTRLFKQLRHELVAVIDRIAWQQRFAARDSSSDVGTAISTDSERQRPGAEM